MSDVNETSPSPDIEKMTLEELCHQVIWEHIMAGTAWCGWKERARLDLVKNVQEAVSWAISQKTMKIKIIEGDGGYF